MNMLTSNNLIESLAFAAKNSEKGIYLISSPEDEIFLPYHELLDTSEKVLAFLQSKGLTKGSTAIFQVSDEKDFLVLFWSCILGGIIPVPLTLAKNQAQIIKLYKVIEAVEEPVIIGDLTNLDKVFSNHHISTSKEVKVIPIQDIYRSNEKGNIEEMGKEDVAFIQFSSGSTGKPKGIVLTHGNLMANMEGISKSANYNSGDRLLSWMPLTHDMGMIGFHLNPLCCGLDQFIISTSAFIKKPSLWLDKATEHQITVTSSPNFGYKYLMLRTDLSQQKWDLSNIRIIYNGAEPISLSICEEFLFKMQDFDLSREAMVPVYGLAEASVAVSMTDLSAEVQCLTIDRDSMSVNDPIRLLETAEDGVSFVNVGKPVAHCEVRIGDEKGQELQEGVIGSILIKGANVCQTYYNNATAHNEIMKSDGWLDTGDLGFQWHGNLYITGRAKDILFVNGQNYFSHDIEREMEVLDDIELNRFVVTGYFDSDVEKERILAFVHYKGRLDSFITLSEKLQRTVKQKFGFEFSHIIPVKSVPKTTSGKLQRFELLKAFQNGDFKAVLIEIDALMSTRLSQTQELMGSDIEKVRTIWSRVLRISMLQTTDNFSAIGGNSMEAAEICNLIEQHWSVKLTLDRFYSLGTIENLAANLDQLPSQSFDPVKASDPRKEYNLADAQSSLYYHWKNQQESIAYNVPVVLEADHSIDLERIKAIFQILVTRHEALRMRFRSEDALSHVTDKAGFEWGYLAQDEQDIEEKLVSLLKPFDLVDGPLLRVYVVEHVHSGSSLLYLDFHHIIADGQSIHLLLSEFMKLYKGETLSHKKLDYTDYILWQENEKPNSIADNITFWSEELSGEVPVLELPTDGERPSEITYAGRRLEFGMDRDTTMAINRFCQQEQITAHNFLFACYYLLLSKYALQNEIIIGIPHHGRNHKDLNDIFGMFVNSLPIRILTKAGNNVKGLIDLVTTKIIQAMDHSDLHYFNMLKLSDQVLTPGRNPLFDTMFIYRDGLNGEDFKVSGFKKYHFDPGTSKFDLTLDIEERKGLLSYTFEFSTALFENRTIRRLAGSFEKIVKDIMNDPAQQLSDISVISQEDLNKIQDISTGELVDGEFQPIHQMFLERAAMDPEMICIEDLNRSYTYREVEQAVYALSSLLREETVAGGVVAVMLPRSAELIIALLGIMNAGCVFLPIDEDMNDERKKELLQRSKSSVLISTESSAGKLKLDSREIRLLTLDKLDAFTSTEVSHASGVGELCYVMFTSGSTGVPKGVMITHGNLYNYISWATQHYFDQERLNVPLYSSISFDLTITSIFAPLVSGGKIIIYEKAENDEVLIERVFRENKVDLVKMTPSHLKLLLDNKAVSNQTRIKKYILGGEALPTELAQELVMATAPDVIIYNEYGPTEATVGCITYQYDESDLSNQVPIGQPIQNMNSYILDTNLQRVPFNVPGELYLSGKSLAKGYFEQPELTEERFVDNPFVFGDTIYKTGDVAELSPNGYIQYIGRNDRQVKINGYRVELGEVEAKISQCDIIDEVVVLHVREPYSRLIAFCLATPGADLDESELRQSISTSLPHYMMPETFLQIDSMPLTANGKIDTEALIKLNPSPSGLPEVNSFQVANTLVEVWRKFFANPQIDIHSNFFELGGDSIKAVQLSARLQEIGIEVSSREILTNSSILSLSAYCQVAETTFEAEDSKGHMLPTPIMSWFLNQGHANPDYYNQSVLLELKLAPEDELLLNKAWIGLIKKHPTLRLNYDADQARFFYNEDHLSKENIVTYHVVRDNQELKNLCVDLKSSFDLSSSLLIQPAVIKCDGLGYLFITAHHLVVDAVSWRILLEDLQKNLSDLIGNEGLSTNSTGVSLKTWSNHLEALAQSSDYEQEQLHFWKPNQATEFYQTTALHPDQRRVEHQEVMHFELDEEATASLQEEVRQTFNCDLDVLLNAALVEVLCERVGSSKLVIEQENHGRHHANFNLGNTVGWFTSLYPLLFEYHAEIGTLIGSVKEKLQKVPEHGLGYGVLTAAGKLNSEQQVGIRLNYLGELGTEFDNEFFTYRGDIPTGKEQDDNNLMSAELEVNAMIVNNKLRMEIYFNRHAYSSDTIRDIGSATLQFLCGALDFMQSVTTPQYTPSDFTADIDKHELDMLLSED